MIVRFAELCDKCQRRSAEYSRWAVCRQCADAVCTLCRVPGTTIEADLDTPESCLCWECNNYD
jgi:hypothetical protein